MTASHDGSMVSENTAAEFLAVVSEKTTFCLGHYKPYLRKDFNMEQLSVITQIPLAVLQYYFSLSGLSFDSLINEWRVCHAKNIMHIESSNKLELHTIAMLSGFATLKKFIETFVALEGISPEIYQSQINEPK